MIGSSHINGRHIGLLYRLQYINTISLSPHNVSVIRASLEVNHTSRKERLGEEMRREERLGVEREDESGESAMLVSTFNRHYRRLDCLL